MSQQLFSSAKNGDLNGVMKALSGGANVNAKDRDGRTVVHIAVEEQNEKLLQYLITEPGVNLNLRDGQGQTPLYLAVSAGLKGIALMLAENGADIEGVEEPEANAGGAGGLDDEIDAAFQDLGLDMGDLDKLSSSSQPARKPEAIKANTGGSWEDEMAEMDRFLDEAGAGDGPAFQAAVAAAAKPQKDVEEDARLAVQREKPALLQPKYADGDVDNSGLRGLDDVDQLLGQIKSEESHQLAVSTQFIVNQDAISNCVIDFISIFAKSVSGALAQEDQAEFMSLAEYLREEIMVNYDKFSMWLETLPNENLVTLHANRNQLKQSSAALLEEVKRFVGEGGKKGEGAKALLTRVQTVVGDCWSFYTNSNDPWKYDHVIFAQIEELIKVVKRLFLAAKCESGEDWVTICLIASNQTVIVSRLANFISFSKRSLDVQKDISNVVVLLSKLTKRIIQVGDDFRRVPDNAKFKLQLNELQKAFINQIRVLHGKIRTPMAAADSVVYTPETLLELATGYKSASKSLLDSIDNFCQIAGTSSDVDVQEMIELGEFISRDVAKMSKLFRDIPASLVVNVLNIAFNVSKLARVVVKWAELPSTHQITRDLLLSCMQTALNYSIQAKLLSSLKAASYPIVEIESSTYTAMRGLSMAIAALYDACCFLDFSQMEQAVTPADADPNAVAHATALCLHFGFATPVERKIEIEEHFADNPDINVRSSTTPSGSALDSLDLDIDDLAGGGGGGGRSKPQRGNSTLNADDLLNSVEDLLADPSMHQKPAASTSAPKQGGAAAPAPAKPAPVEEEEEDFPPLEPLPAQPPPLSDTEGYKAYMQLRYSHQQRENAILLRQMKRERAAKEGK